MTPGGYEVDVGGRERMTPGGYEVDVGGRERMTPGRYEVDAGGRQRVPYLNNKLTSLSSTLPLDIYEIEST